MEEQLQRQGLILGACPPQQGTSRTLANDDDDVDERQHHPEEELTGSAKTSIQLIEGQRPVLLVIDILQGCFDPDMPGMFPGNMPDYVQRMQAAATLIHTIRHYKVPIIFVQEAHRPDHVDFGRELDGAEDVHCLETDPNTAIAQQVGMRSQDYFIRKRRYSCFFATDLEILLKGLKATTLILIGGLTDVCVHYTFVDGHQHDYHCRVVEDCVAGSSQEPHDASLKAMEYLQRRARCTSTQLLEALEDFKCTPP